MGIINIAPVTRTGMRYIISLYGMSETGKTLSALRLAAGLEPDPAKRGLLDTEGGQRGRAYVDHVPGGYLYGALTPPFSPERYIEAINEFEGAGCNVLTIDSASHAWFAEGGVLDMVEAAPERNDLAKWAKPKRRLGKMTRRILSSDMHIILCSRAKQPMVEEVVDGKKKYVPGDIIPIQEKGLRFDMTIMARMLGDGRFDIKAPAGKCPGALRPIFANHEVMDEEMGQKLAEWIKAEPGKAPALRQVEISATAAAEEGTEAFREFWKGLMPMQRDHLKPMLANYQSIAKASDEEALPKDTREDDSDPFKIDASGVKPVVEPQQTAADVVADDTIPGDWPDYLEKIEGDLADAKTAEEIAGIGAGVKASIETAVKNGEITEAQGIAIGRAWATMKVQRESQKQKVGKRS